MEQFVGNVLNVPRGKAVERLSIGCGTAAGVSSRDVDRNQEKNGISQWESHDVEKVGGGVLKRSRESGIFAAYSSDIFLALVEPTEHQCVSFSGGFDVQSKLWVFPSPNRLRPDSSHVIPAN